MPGRLITTLTVVMTSVVAVVSLAWLFARVFAPERLATSTAPAKDFNASVMAQAVKPEAVAVEHERLLAMGSRYLGQPGMYEAGAYIRSAFQAAGLEIHEQPIRTVAPRTAFREVYRAHPPSKERPYGEPIPDVQIYPFMPNHLQPVVAPPAGLDGELLLLDTKTLATRHNFSDVIGLIDASPGGVSGDYAYQWARYAQLGVKAIIISHRQGLSAIDWQSLLAKTSGLVSSVPVNYVRLAANEAIFNHLGERIRLRVRVDFVEHPNRTIYGVLRATRRKASEAIVVYAPHDATAVLPDLAPGALPAINTAYFLQLVKGLAAAKETLQRDVIFMASGASVMDEDGITQLVRVLQYNASAGTSNRLMDAFKQKATDSPNGNVVRSGGGAFEQIRELPIKERAAENNTKQAQLTDIVRAFQDPNFLLTTGATQSDLSKMPQAARAFFTEQMEYVLNTIVFERQEEVLQAKLRFEREGKANAQSQSFLEYIALRRKLDAANAVAGSQSVALLRQSTEYAKTVRLRQRAETRLVELKDWHEHRKQELDGDIETIRLFSAYREFGLFRPQFVPAPQAESATEVISLYAGNVRETQSVDLLLADAARRTNLPKEVFQVEPIAASPVVQTTVVQHHAEPAPLHYYWMLYANAYMAAGLVNFDRVTAYQQWSSPTVQPFMRNLASLRGSFAASGELFLQLAHGSGMLGGSQGYPWQRKSYGGRVLASNVGQSVVPNYPLKYAMLGARTVDREELHSYPGYWEKAFYRTDPYGRFDLPELASDFPVWWRMYNDGAAFTPLAVGYGADGLITYMKDEGDEGQRLFKSITIPVSNERLLKNITIVTFRAAPISIIDLTNPQNFKDYTEVEMVTQEGLTPFTKNCQYSNGLGFITTYLPPDHRAYALLKSGRPDNENVRDIRAFLLNTTKDDLRSAREIDGRGYLVADTPFLLRVPFEAAASLDAVSGKRLALQNRYGMADARTNDYHQKSLSLLSQAMNPDQSARDAALHARDSVSYAALVHPVLRESVFEAVIGILWYLALLVPFVFFAEKLVFGFSDVRRQIATQAVIFLVVFGLLRLLHPAFQMVRSSLMILLGFVILLISCGITVLFAGKAKENLAELRKRQGRVDAANVNTLGVLGSSFLVALNNMRRRKLRTGLTSATLTLLTFVMICFTSTQNDLVDKTLTVGRAEYQGLLTKHDEFLEMKDSESFAVKSKFSDRFIVSERRYVTGAQDWQERKKRNPPLVAEIKHPEGMRQASFSSILTLGPTEPLRNKIRVITKNGWFLPQHAQSDGSACPALIPDRLADRLGLSVKAIEAGDVTLVVNDKPLRVWGVFTAESLDGLRDLDGSDLLPFDIERVARLTDTKWGYTVESDAPRIPAERVIIIPIPIRDLKLGAINGREAREVIASVAVDMNQVSFRQAKDAIDAHLEKTALPAFYGLDGIAYSGLRTRQLTLAGLLDLLVPLLLAGLTVLNTMRGSVYERRSEIYVYNAVGISPRYVLVMFLSEAFVYIVVGSILGYLLSQGIGRVLSELDLTGGLNMTFTSLSTIYASLAIAAAVLVSTWFPARSAVQIAAPADESGWKLPEPEGDVLAFDLPFNFRTRGRIAVLAFFERWLLEHGEGSAGPFFAGEPVMGIADVMDPITSGMIPQMILTVWLKPFDLAVSQELVIATPFDPETQQFKARLTLTRMSGTRESWLRLNKSFVATLRRHFLHWRAVSSAERDEMYLEAKLQLEARYAEWAEPSAARSANA